MTRCRVHGEGKFDSVCTCDKNKIAAYSNEGFMEDGKFFVALAYATGGYVPMLNLLGSPMRFDTVEEARDMAQHYNRNALGITQAEALAIVVKSMAVQGDRVRETGVS